MDKEYIQSNESMKIESAKDLGNFMREIRESQKMTQADICGLADTGNRFIVELENGKPIVQFQKVLNVLHVLGLEIVNQKNAVSDALRCSEYG